MSEEAEECKCPEGIPAWVMTFADLMSLLLAFFVLLFSFSEMDKAIYKELAGSLKDAFGVQREIKAKETPRGINIIAREFSPGRPQETAVNEVRQMTTNESKMFPVFTDASLKGQENMEKKTKSADDQSFNAMSENIKGMESLKGMAEANASLNEEDLDKLNKLIQDAESVSQVLEDEINKGVVDLEVTDKTIIIRIKETGAFPSGSAEVIKPFKMIVDKISGVFGDFDGTIIVSGHTDNIPINTYRFRSNWELSSSRAVSVLHVLKGAKDLKDKNFKVAAFAETKPLAPNDTREGRASNRRVEIMMDYTYATVPKAGLSEGAPNKEDSGGDMIKSKILDSKMMDSAAMPSAKNIPEKMMMDEVNMSKDNLSGMSQDMMTAEKMNMNKTKGMVDAGEVSLGRVSTGGVSSGSARTGGVAGGGANMSLLNSTEAMAGNQFSTAPTL